MQSEKHDYSLLPDTKILSIGRRLPVARRRFIRRDQSHAYDWNSIIPRIITFVFLELAFIVLAWIAYKKQGLPLHIHISDLTAKSITHGFFTVLVITWNTIAVSALKDIVLYMFSTEWLSQEKEGALIAGEADRVSVVTSGLTDQIPHFFSGVATGRYKISMVMFVLLLFSKGFVPGTISLDTAFVNVTLSQGLDIANVTFASNSAEQVMGMGLTRATFLMRVEQLEGLNFGYNSSNFLIPWPEDMGPMTAGVKLHKQLWYQSDVMSYGFICNWTAPVAQPQFNVSNNFSVWEVEMNGQKTPLRSSPNWDILGLTPLTLLVGDWRDHPLVIFAFQQLVGDPATSTSFALNDQDPIKRFDPPVSCDGKQNSTNMEAASILICDPQLNIYTAEVEANLLASPTLEVSREVSSVPTVGNFAQGFETELLLNLFFGPLTLPDSLFGKSQQPGFNSLTRLLFFCHRSDSCKGNFPPLPLWKITQNMNAFFGSGMKAYLDGYNGTVSGLQNLAVSNYYTFPVDVIIQENIGLMLVTSLPFVITITVAFVCIVCLLIILYFNIGNLKDLRSFSLDTIADVFDVKPGPL